VQAFKKVLDSLHTFSAVHLIVATSVEGPDVQGLWGGSVVELSHLGNDAGLQLLDHKLGPEHPWTCHEREAARKLVEAVHGNAMVLGVAAGLLLHGNHDHNFTWQVSSRRCPDVVCT
jgi:hypothetical protein